MHAVVGDVVIVELDLSQSLRGALVEEECVVCCIVTARHLGVFLRIEEVVGHEFHDQGHVHMNRSLQLGQHGDLDFGDLKEGLVLEPLGGDDIMENIHHILALARHLHLHHGVEQKITAVVGIGRNACSRLPVRQRVSWRRDGNRRR